MDKQSIIFVAFQKDRQADGGVRSLSEIINCLLGYKPLIVTQRETAQTAEWRNRGHRVKLFDLPYTVGESFRSAPLIKKLRWLRSYVKTNWRIWLVIRGLRAPLVYANDLPAFYHSVVGARIAGAKVVLAFRDTKNTYNWKWKLAGKLSSQCVVLSKEMKEELIGGGVVRENKVAVLYSVVLSTEIPKTVDDPEIAIGVVGAVESKKGQRELLEHCIRDLVGKHPHLHFYFIGDCNTQKSEYAASCLDFVLRNQLEANVTFTGFVANMEPWFSRFDMLVIASRHEGLPRAMAESLSYGVPVISFATCSAAELLAENNCGYVVRMDDYKTLGSHIVSLAADSELRAKLGEKGKRAAREYFGSNAKREVVRFINQMADSL